MECKCMNESVLKPFSINFELKSKQEGNFFHNAYPLYPAVIMLKIFCIDFLTFLSVRPSFVSPFIGVLSHLVPHPITKFVSKNVANKRLWYMLGVKGTYALPLGCMRPGKAPLLTHKLTLVFTFLVLVPSSCEC